MDIIENTIYSAVKLIDSAKLRNVLNEHIKNRLLKSDKKVYINTSLNKFIKEHNLKRKYIEYLNLLDKILMLEHILFNKKQIVELVNEFTK